MPDHPMILIEGTPRPAPREDGVYITQERWGKIVENSNRADKLTGVHPISGGGWETVAVILMDEVKQLRTIIEAQGEIIDWYETEINRDNAEEDDVPEELRELEIVLKAAQAAGGE